MKKKRLLSPGELFLASYFSRAVKQYRKNSAMLSATVLFDVIFIGSFYLSLMIFSWLTPDPETMAAGAGPVLMILFAIAYIGAFFLLCVLVYSFFKFLVLRKVKSVTGKSRLCFGDFAGFYLLNIIVLGVSGLILLAVNYFNVMVVKPNLTSWYVLATTAAFAFFFYAYLNISQFYFDGRRNIREILPKANHVVFKRIPSYAGIYLFSFLLLILYFIIWQIIGGIYMISAGSYSLAALQTSGYAAVFSVMTLVFIYLILNFNRVYFQVVLADKKM